MPAINDTTINIFETGSQTKNRNETAYTMVLLKSIFFSLMRLSRKAAGSDIKAVPTAPADKTVPMNDSVAPCSRRYKFRRSIYAEKVRPIKNDAARYRRMFLEKRFRL